MLRIYGDVFREIDLCNRKRALLGGKKPILGPETMGNP